MTIHFHDVSSFQGDFRPTGPIIAKATEGTGYVDLRFATTRQRTLAGGWPFLAYHFLRTGNVAGQVANAVAVVGKGQPLMLDIETGIDNTDPTLAEAAQFIDLYAAHAAGGKVTLGYLPHWYWQGAWKSPNLAPLLTHRGAGLISSDYVPYSDNSPGWNPYGGVRPVITQWTSTPIDTNAFKGSVAQLEAVFAGHPADVATPPKEEPEMPFYLIQDKATGEVYAANGVTRVPVSAADLADAEYVQMHEAQYVTGKPVVVANPGAFGALGTTATVDADAVAAALAANTTFLAAMAKAVNDDAYNRMAR